MGALKGSITYAKFLVRGALPDDLHQKFLARIRTRAFKPLTPEDEDDVSVGWMPIERPFDEDPSFRADGTFFGGYLALAMRLDRWKFPSSLVKSKMAAAEKAYLEKHQKERLSRAEKAELRDTVERRLRREGEPSSKAIDLAWNLQDGELRVFGRSKALLEHLTELFEKTFAVELVAASPYPLALEQKLPKDVEKALVHVEPCSFHTRKQPQAGAARSTEPSLAELVESRRFLGREFLTWLWFRSEILGNELRIEGFGTSELWLEKSIVLEATTEAGKEKATLTGVAPSGAPEAKRALQQAKLPTRAKLCVRRGDQDFALTVDADSIGLSGVKIPALLTGEGDDPFHERMQLVEEIEGAIESLYKQFLVERVRSGFADETLPAMYAWLHEEDEAVVAKHRRAAKRPATADA